MNIERWNPEEHMPLLSEWLQAREQAEGAGDPRMYPPSGFVVDRCALGFLYATNAPLVGYLDGIVTAPAVSAKRRYQALGVLCGELLQEAERLGVTLLLGNTNIRGLVSICLKAGFVPYASGYTCIARISQPKDKE